MDIGSLDSFLFRYTESELRHRGEPPDALSPRYRRIPQVTFAGRDMYLFSFNSLMEGRSICVNKESRFTFIPEHIHTVIEFLYVYAGHCTQVIDGRRVEMSAGDICLLDTNVPHSIEYLNESDIVITIEMRKEYLTRGFLQRLGDNESEALPASETAELELGQLSKFTSALRRAMEIWLTAIKGAAVCLLQARCDGRSKSREPQPPGGRNFCPAYAGRNGFPLERVVFRHEDRLQSLSLFCLRGWNFRHVRPG